jgi:uncharacterized membrane protein (GlpM family)
MKEHLIRLILDLFYTACYIFLVHAGYNITDKLQAGRNNIVQHIIAWVVAATIMFFLTKQRYDKEVEEGKGDEI